MTPNGHPLLNKNKNHQNKILIIALLIRIPRGGIKQIQYDIKLKRYNNTLEYLNNIGRYNDTVSEK